MNKNNSNEVPSAMSGMGQVVEMVNDHTTKAKESIINEITEKVSSKLDELSNNLPKPGNSKEQPPIDIKLVLPPKVLKPIVQLTVAASVDTMRSVWNDRQQNKSEKVHKQAMRHMFQLEQGCVKALRLLLTYKGIVFFAFLLVNMFLVCYLFVSLEQNKQLVTRYEDNDLKYRYVVSLGWANSRILNFVDSVFTYGTDAEKEVIRSKVASFEVRQKEVSDSIIRAEMVKQTR